MLFVPQWFFTRLLDTEVFLSLRNSYHNRVLHGTLKGSPEGVHFEVLKGRYLLPMVLKRSRGYVTQMKFCPLLMPESGYENLPAVLRGGKWGVLWTNQNPCLLSNRTAPGIERREQENIRTSRSFTIRV